MNPTIKLDKTTMAFLLALALFCFGLSPLLRAVVPALDGGYPGFNTAEGEDALLSLTSGTYNTALGFLSLQKQIRSAYCGFAESERTARRSEAVSCGLEVSEYTCFVSLT